MCLSSSLVVLVLSSVGDFPYMLVLNLNDLELTLLNAWSFFSSLEKLNKDPYVFVKLLLYSIKLYIFITISKSSALSISTPFILLIHFKKGAISLKIIFLFLTLNLFPCNISLELAVLKLLINLKLAVTIM